MRVRSILLCLVVSAFFIYCDKPTPTAKIDTTISGKVLDAATGKPIQGATVSTEPPTEQVATDSEGRFFIDIGVEVGTNYRVTASKGGYLFNSVVIQVVEGENRVADVQLYQVKIGVSGRVSDASTGEPIAGATITTDPISQSVATDSDGRYVLDNLIKDVEYSVTAAKEGYDTKTITVLVIEDQKYQSGDIQLVLSPVPQVSLTRGPEERVTLSMSEVTFGWEGTTTAYRYRLVNSSYYEDFRETDASSVVLKDLDESPEHVLYTFEVVGVGEDGRESEPAKRSFRVDAIRGPAVWLRSRRVQIADPSVSPEFTLEVMAEEVVDLLMAHLVVRFDPERMRIRAVDRGDFLLSRSDAGHLLFFPSEELEANTDGVLVVDMGALQSRDQPAVSGSGILARIRFSVLVRSQETEVDFGPDTELVNATNEDIVLKAKIGSKVEVR